MKSEALLFFFFGPSLAIERGRSRAFLPPFPSHLLIRIRFRFSMCQLFQTFFSFPFFFLGARRPEKSRGRAWFFPSHRSPPCPQGREGFFHSPPLPPFEVAAFFFFDLLFFYKPAAVRSDTRAPLSSPSLLPPRPMTVSNQLVPPPLPPPLFSTPSERKKRTSCFS